MHSFIHIEHLYSASSRKLLSTTPNASTVKRNSACMYFLCMPLYIFYAFLYIFLIYASIYFVCMPVCSFYVCLYVFGIHTCVYFVCRYLCVILFYLLFISFPEV